METTTTCRSLQKTYPEISNGSDGGTIVGVVKGDTRNLGYTDYV